MIFIIFIFFCHAFANRILTLVETNSQEPFQFSDLGSDTCPENFIPITLKEECRRALCYLKTTRKAECNDAECKDKKNMSKEKGSNKCFGVDMLADKPKIYVAKMKLFNSNSRLLCKQIPQCECSKYKNGASENDEELCISSSNKCFPTKQKKEKCGDKEICRNVKPTTTHSPCTDDNLTVGLILPTLDVPSPKFQGITSNCEFLIGVLDAAFGVGAGCFSFSQYCCSLCTTIATGGVNLGYLSEYRYWLLTIFMQEAFTLEKAEYDAYLENQRYFDENSVVTVPVAGVYSDPESIIEYFLVQNKYYTDGRHYIDPEIEADIQLLEFSETYIEFTYKATAKNYYINDKPFSKLEAHFKATFSTAFDPIVNSLVVDFLDRDVSAMVSSFGKNAELCSQIQAICTGRNQQYESQSECEAYLDSLPLTQSGCPKLKGPTQSCKWTHVILAQPELRPEIHCSHVGMETPDPFGNIKCSIADCNI